MKEKRRKKPDDNIMNAKKHTYIRAKINETKQLLSLIFS